MAHKDVIELVSQFAESVREHEAANSSGSEDQLNAAIQQCRVWN